MAARSPWRPVVGGVLAGLACNGPAPRVAVDQSVLEGSIPFFEARLGQYPDDVVAPGQLADRYLARFGWTGDIGDVWRAESVLVRGLAAHPGDGALLARHVAVHLARHEFPEALQAARQAYRSTPRRAINGPLFDAWLEVGAFDSARTALDRMDPNSFGYLIRKARYAETVGRPDLAEAALARGCRREWVADARLAAWCAVRRADLAVTTGRVDLARQWLRHALVVIPEYPAARAGLAEIAQLEHQPDEAIRLWSAVAERPGGAEGYLRLAELLAQQGDTAGAAAARERFERTATDPRYGRAYWPYLARMYSEAGEHGRALALAERDLAQRPAPEAYHTLASVQFRADRLVAAHAAVARALSWGSRAPDLLALRDSILGLARE